MNLRTFLADQDGSHPILMVLNATTNMGSFRVGLGVGQLKDGRIQLTLIGQACANRLVELDDRTDHPLHMVEIASQNKLKDKVRNAFLRATPGDSIFFVCGNDKIYDKVFEQLNFSKPDGELGVVH